MKQDRGWDNFDNTGPYWSFSSPRVTEWFLNEVAAEIVREANVQVSRLDHTLFIHFLYLLITFLFYIYIYFSLASKWDKSDEVVQHFVAAKKRGRLLWWNGLSLLWRDCWKLQCRCSYWRRSAALADDSNRCSNHFKHFQTISYSRGFVLTLNIGHTIGEYQRHTQDLLQLFAIAKLAKTWHQTHLDDQSSRQVLLVQSMGYVLEVKEEVVLQSFTRLWSSRQITTCRLSEDITVYSTPI